MRFVANNNSYSHFAGTECGLTLPHQFQDPSESHGKSWLLQASSNPLDATHTNGSLAGDTLLFASGRDGLELRTSHPPPIHIFWLWQTFLENVHPLSMLLHAPTVQSQITIAAQNVGEASSGLIALMFAIYTAAISSSDNVTCKSALGESKAKLLTRYSSAARQALVNADYLRTTDLTVLQAFVLLLVSRNTVGLRDH